MALLLMTLSPPMSRVVVISASKRCCQPHESPQLTSGRLVIDGPNCGDSSKGSERLLKLSPTQTTAPKCKEGVVS